MHTDNDRPMDSGREGAADRGQGVLLMSAGGVLLGTVGLFVEKAGQSPLTAVFFLCAFGALILFSYALLVRRGSELRLTAAGFRIAILTGGLMSLNWACFFAAIGDTSIAIATVAFHVQPLWVMAFGMIFWGESRSPVRIGAGFAALIGLALATGLATHSASAEQTRYLHGLGYAFVASLSYTAVTLIAKTQRSMSTFGLAAWQCAIGAILLAWWPWFHGWPDGAAPWGWLIGLGVGPTAIAYVLLYAGMRHLQAVQIAILQFIYPITAILVDHWVFGNRLSPVQWAGVALMGGALWIAGRPRLST
jgi:drug/metabolite transporter (DMT)-like permease